MTRCRYSGNSSSDATKVDKKVQVTIDYSAMNKFIMPRDTYDGKLYGAMTDIGSLGVFELDGSSVSIGETSLKTTDQIQRIYGLDGVALFMFVFDSTQSAGFKQRLLKSVDPLNTSFVDVTPAAGIGDGTVYYENLVSCTTGTQTVLFLFEYGNDAGTNSAYYSTDDGDTWTDLFGKECPGIAHFHGSQIKEGYAGANGDRLYVFYGDGSPTSGATGLGWTDDIDDLIANPDDWFDRWGLGGTLASPAVPTESGAFTIGRENDNFGTQAGRLIQMVDDGDKAYWLADTDGGDYVELDFATNTIRTIKEDIGAVGYGWTGIKTAKGDIIFSTGSSWDIAGGDWTGSSDRYLRLYAASSDRTELFEIARVPRFDYSSTVVPLSSSANLNRLIDYEGSLWVNGSISPYGEDLYGQMEIKSNNYMAFRVVSTDDLYDLEGSWNCPARQVSWPITSNMTKNPQFEDGTTDWNSGLLGTGGTFTADPTVVEGGHTNSAKIDLVGGAGQGQAQITGFNLNGAANLPKIVKGKFVTITAKIRISSTFGDGGTGLNLRPAIGIVGPTGAAVYMRFPLDTTLFDDEWHEVWYTTYIPRAATNIWPVVYADINTGGLRTGTVWASDVRFSLGCLPAANNMPSYQYFQ